MAPYFEVDGNSAQGCPVNGLPLPKYFRERKLFPGEEVILLERNSIYTELSKGSVSARIVSDNTANVLVKTGNCNYIPGVVKDKEKGTFWYGSILWPCSQETEHRTKPYFHRRIRRQKTFRTKEQTIFTSGTKRIEWREK